MEGLIFGILRYVVPFFIFQRYQEILTSKLSSVGVFGVIFFLPHYSEIANFFIFVLAFFLLIVSFYPYLL